MEGKAELVNGEIVRYRQQETIQMLRREIFVSLRDDARCIGRGKAYTDGVGFHVNLPHRESFRPGSEEKHDADITPEGYCSCRLHAPPMAAPACPSAIALDKSPTCVPGVTPSPPR